MTFLFRFLELLCEALTLLIIIRAIASWISPGQTNILTKTLYRVTEPMLGPLRRIIPSMGVVDLTPLVAVVILRIIIVIIP